MVLDVLPWLDAISETTTIWLWMWLQMTLQVLFIFLASLLRDQVGRRMVCIGGDARDQKLREAVSQKRFFLSEPSWSLPVWALALGLSPKRWANVERAIHPPEPVQVTLTPAP